MNQQEQQALGDRLGPRESMNVLYFAALSLSACFRPWLRRGMGPERPGWAGVAALIYMLGYAAAMNAPEVHWYLLAWLAMLLVRRAETFRLLQAGARLHSRDHGYPWLALRLPWVKNMAGALTAEVGLVLLLGVLASPFSPALAGFCWLASAGLAVARGIDSQITRKRVQRMRDAEIEQRYLADLYRNRRDDY